MLQQILLHCYFHFCYINCWLILPSCCKTHRKLLVFDRPSIFPLILVFLSCSPLYSLPFPSDTVAYCLVARRKTCRYTRYSPALFSPLLFFLIGRCSRRWSVGLQEPKN